ncbi:MAG: GDSL-type esterase/lipase family protein [Muribaculaceae bacterium]|nr:GDSL-type esterase/lipase family protein [Muribaculaceae bacterium]
MNRSVLTALLMLGASMLPARAEDEAQTELRLNPDIECGAQHGRVDVSAYPFIKSDRNKIELNGSDWSVLAAKFEAAARGDSLFTVVYLGDSHVQADFGGAVLRSKLCSASRSAGRGLIVPFKLAGTNEPRDYTFRTTEPYQSSKLLKMPWATDMLFTGISIEPAAPEADFSITCTEPFTQLRTITSAGGCSVALDSAVCSYTLHLDDARRHTLGGVVLSRDSVGTFVHSIGNNGATYSSYSLVEGFGDGLSTLSPDLIVIALGTNEAFGRSSSESIEADISSLTSTIRRHCPQAKLLLVTPAECYRSSYRRVRTKSGRRRRVRSTVVNGKVASVASTVKAFAAAHGIALYDHYGVAGGTGAAAAMKKAGVLGKDGVHYTVAGYELWGALLAEAILEEIGAGVEKNIAKSLHK